MVWRSHFAARSCAHLTEAAAVERAREDFLRRRPRSLEFLFRKRYEWMREFALGRELVVDLGCGLGLSREFIGEPRILLTDVNAYPWIDRRVDALDPPFEPGSVDAFICGHVVHHLAKPVAFFEKLALQLKPGGHVLIQELETTPFLKLLLALRRIEGWDEGVDVFDPAVSCTRDERDPWSANCAIPRLLFRSKERFERAVPSLELLRSEPCEFLVFPLSGGVLAKVPAPSLPAPVLALLDQLDRLAVGLLPGWLALGRRVVLRRRA